MNSRLRSHGDSCTQRGMDPPGKATWESHQRSWLNQCISPGTLGTPVLASLAWEQEELYATGIPLHWWLCWGIEAKIGRGSRIILHSERKDGLVVKVLDLGSIFCSATGLLEHITWPLCASAPRL